MAYPEPVPEMTMEEGEEFLSRLEAFRLSPSLRRYYRRAFSALGRARGGLC